MRYIVCVIPCVSFVETGTGFEVLTLFRAERRIESTIGKYRAECAELFAIIVFISQRAIIEQLGIFFLP